MHFMLQSTTHIPSYYLTCLHVNWRSLIEVIVDRAAIILKIVGWHVRTNERTIEGLRHMRLLPAALFPELITFSHPTTGGQEIKRAECFWLNTLITTAHYSLVPLVECYNTK